MVVSEVGISGNAHVPHCFPVPSVGKNKDVEGLGCGIRLQSFLKLKEKKTPEHLLHMRMYKNTSLLTTHRIHCTPTP